MNKVTIETPFGTTLEYQHCEGIFQEKFSSFRLKDGDLHRELQTVANLGIRDDDIYLATFPKSGTHWVWEILTMLRRGTADYEVKLKEDLMLEFRTADKMDGIPSPRIINSHYPVKCTPRGILEKGLKIVHVQRNPKDVFVSWYHHTKSNDHNYECENFSRFLQLAIGTYGFHRYYPWFKYVKEWERFRNAHPDQVLILNYEDIKEDPVREIKKLNEFFQWGRSDKLIKEIAHACSFQNLKKADVTVKDHSVVDERHKGKPRPNMYRKGEVGDWKNWFTVADNEKMDAWLQENLVDTDLKFRYEL